MALEAAVSRGVHVSVVVETLQGAGSALAGDEPYQAFTVVDGIELWQWPSAKRTKPGAKMHAKLAVADRCVLFVTSANLTQSGVGKNIEAGLLVRGGTETVYRHVIVPEIRGGATVMDDVFNDDEYDPGESRKSQEHLGTWLGTQYSNGDPINRWS